VLEANEALDLPAMFILHGKADRAVPVEGSVKFVEAVKRKFPKTNVRLELREGEDHGNDALLSLETEWFKQDVEFIVKNWLG